jgi:hypothetical protein
MVLLGSVKAVMRAISLYCHGAVVNTASVSRSSWCSMIGISSILVAVSLFSLIEGSISCVELIGFSALYSFDMRRKRNEKSKLMLQNS